MFPLLLACPLLSLHLYTAYPTPTTTHKPAPLNMIYSSIIKGQRPRETAYAGVRVREKAREREREREKKKETVGGKRVNTSKERVRWGKRKQRQSGSSDKNIRNQKYHVLICLCIISIWCGITTTPLIISAEAFWLLYSYLQSSLLPKSSHYLNDDALHCDKNRSTVDISGETKIAAAPTH